MNQTKAARMHPGAFRSCLIPFTDQILEWWYDDLLTAAEIQRRLKAEGLDVARTTVMRFIKVREQRAAKRKRPPALRKENKISVEQPMIPPPSQIQSRCLGAAALPAFEPTNNIHSSFPVFLNCSRESREVPEFIVPTLIEKNTNFFG